MHRLIDSPQHTPVSRSVLQGEDATLDGRLADAGERDAVAAEAILPGDRVPQQDDRRIAVILKRRVEGRYGKRTRRRVTRGVGRRTGHSCNAGREAGAGRRVASEGNARTVVGNRRRRVIDHLTSRSRAGILIGYCRLVSRASDHRRLRVVDRDGESAACRVAR